MNNTTKVRIVLIAATTIYLILIGYLLWIKAVRMPEFEWEIKALIIGAFTIFGTFNFTSENAFFIILLSFGIFVLPFVINESGILDNYPDEPPDADVEGGYTIEEAEESFDRFIEYANRRIDYVKKHALPIGLALTIIGICILVVGSVYLRGEGSYWHEWQKEIIRNYEFLSLPLALIAFSFLIIGLALIGLTYAATHTQRAKKNSFIHRGCEKLCLTKNVYNPKAHAENEKN